MAMGRNQNNPGKLKLTSLGTNDMKCIFFMYYMKYKKR